MKDLNVAINELLQDHQAGHSGLQIDQFIALKGNWTPYGRYKQCLREIDGRHRGLQELHEEAELATLDLDQAASLLSGLPVGTSDHVRRRIDRDRKRRRLADIQRTIADQQRELDRFVELATDLKEQIGELTPERRAVLDREMWAVRTRAMVALDMFSTGSISASTAELLIALPADMRQPILEAAHSAESDGGLFDWLTEGPKALPE